MILAQDNRSLLYRFAGRNRYTSFTYPQGGYTLTEKHVSLSKIGKVRVKVHREIAGTIKTATVKHESEQWYIVVRRFGACLITP